MNNPHLRDLFRHRIIKIGQTVGITFIYVILPFKSELMTLMSAILLTTLPLAFELFTDVMMIPENSAYYSHDHQEFNSGKTR